jgi:CelD/BcsL family acetyltransferase involved in cellulose biosynthesis
MNYTIIEDDLFRLKKYRDDSGQNLNWSSVYVLPDWMEVWWQVFGSEADMLVRTVRAGEKVVGIAPLMIKKGVAYLIGDTDVCDYHDFIITPGLEKEFFNLILDDLGKNGIRHLDLKHLRPDSTVLTSLMEIAEKRRYPIVSTQDALSLEIELPSLWDEYLATLSSKQRHEVRRKLRRLFEEGKVEYRFISNRADLTETMAVFFRMFVESRQDKAAFLTEKMKSFFILLADTMARKGLLKLGTLILNEQPLAEIMCFDYNRCIYLYNSGYDPHYTSLSAGLVCKVLAIKAGIEQGYTRFDFLKGAEPYKYHLGGKEVPLYRCQITLN